MDLKQITEKIKNISEKNSGKIESKFKFVLDDGCIYIDDTLSPPNISNDDLEADCTITINNENFKKLLDKEIDSMQAFMTGKMKIDGEMTVAMKLSSIFG